MSTPERQKNLGTLLGGWGVQWKVQWEPVSGKLYKKIKWKCPNLEEQCSYRNRCNHILSVDWLSSNLFNHFDWFMSVIPTFSNNVLAQAELKTTRYISFLRNNLVWTHLGALKKGWNMTFLGENQVGSFWNWMGVWFDNSFISNQDHPMAETNAACERFGQTLCWMCFFQKNIYIYISNKIMLAFKSSKWLPTIFARKKKKKHRCHLRVHSRWFARHSLALVTVGPAWETGVVTNWNFGDLLWSP